MRKKRTSLEIKESTPLLSELEMEQLDSMFALCEQRFPESDFHMYAEERDLFTSLAEMYGFDRMMWVLSEVLLRPGVPTMGTVEIAFNEHIEREEEAIHPAQHEHENKIVNLIYEALTQGKFRNMDEFFSGRESWDTPRIRRKFRNGMLV